MSKAQSFQPSRSMLNNLAFECSEGTPDACGAQVSTLKQYLEETKP